MMSVLSEWSFLSVSANRQNDKNDNLRTYNLLWYLVIFTMSNMLNFRWLNQFYQPSFHRPHIHSKDFRLLHYLLFRKVRGKLFCCTFGHCLAEQLFSQKLKLLLSNSPVATFAQCSPYSSGTRLFWKIRLRLMNLPLCILLCKQASNE